MFIANRTIAPVPIARLGRPGTQRHNIPAPTDWIRGRAIAPAISVWYTQPPQPRIIDKSTESTAATMSLAERAEKRIALFSRAKCNTEVLVMKIVREMPRATWATWGLL